MKSMKKFMALALVLVMVFALSANAFATVGANLVAYNTPYTQIVSNDTGDILTLKVRPATADYAPLGFTESEAAAVVWDIDYASSTDYEDYMFIDDTVEPEAVSNGYAAVADVYIFDGAPEGVISISAEDSIGNKMYFTIAITGANTAATGVKAYYYAPDSDGVMTLMASDASLSVAGNDVYTDTSFANPLDVVYESWLAGSFGTVSNANRPNITNTWAGWVGEYALHGLTFNGSTWYETNYSTNEGWQYRVYRNGAMINASANIGADAFALQNGDVVVWEYGAYGIGFPTSVN